MKSAGRMRKQLLDAGKEKKLTLCCKGKQLRRIKEIRKIKDEECRKNVGRETSYS